MSDVYSPELNPDMEPNELLREGLQGSDTGVDDPNVDEVEDDGDEDDDDDDDDEDDEEDGDDEEAAS